MTARILAGATRDAHGVRICPLGCGPNAPIPPGAKFADHTCKMAKRKSGDRPGETVWTRRCPGCAGCSTTNEESRREREPDAPVTHE